MNMDLNSKDKKFLLPLIIVLLIAVYFTSNYIQQEADLKKLRGAEWIAYDSEGRLYFTYHNKVYRLNSDNTSLEKIVETGLKISSRDIMDIAIAPSGDIFLTDPTSSQINIYSSNGALKYSLKGYFKENARIVVDNERIYLADMQGNRTIALDIKKGDILWTDGNYRTPDSLFVKNSIVYVSDADKKLVRKLNAQNGQVIKDIHMDLSGFVYGSAILVLNDGTFLLAPAYERNGTLKKFSEDGNLIQKINGPDGFTPVDMAISPEGKVTITDDENYSFYSVKKDFVELVKLESIEQLFGNMRGERTSLKKRLLYSKLILLTCVLFLIVLYISYKHYANKESSIYRTENSKIDITTPSEEVVLIKPKKQNLMIMIGAIVSLLILTYFRVKDISQHPIDTVHWVRFAVLVVMWVLVLGSFLYRRKNPQAGILKLTSRGLFKGNTVYRWHDIEQFGITGSKTVFWNLKESSTSRSFINKSSRILSGYDNCILTTNYEIQAEDMVKMLNEWKIRYTGQASVIKYESGLSRNLTKKELLLVGGFFGFILILIIAFVIVNV